MGSRGCLKDRAFLGCYAGSKYAWEYPCFSCGTAPQAGISQPGAAPSGQLKFPRDLATFREKNPCHGLGSAFETEGCRHCLRMFRKTKGDGHRCLQLHFVFRKFQSTKLRTLRRPFVFMIRKLQMKHTRKYPLDFELSAECGGAERPFETSIFETS